MTEAFIRQLIKDCSIAGDDAAVTVLIDMLNEIMNPVEPKRTRAANNTTGYVQVDAETGKEVARYATIKEAIEALNTDRSEDDKIKESASSISAACRNFAKGNSQMAYGFKWFYGADFDAQ